MTDVLTVNGVFMREIYLDNSATTRVMPEVAELMCSIMTGDYGNPSSMHLKGVEAERYLKNSREKLASILKVQEKEILFTSCGTESDNIALLGTARANMRRGKHLITTKIEHPAILNTMKQLEEEGFEVTYLGVDSYGVISLTELEEAIREDTILVSIMHINNEIGSVQPIAEAGALIKKKNPNTYFHVDAVQSFGKQKIYPKKMNIDMLSVSGHKIHGPKGIGFLYISDKVKIKPVMFGGGQQGGLRSGTENVPSIAGMALAAEYLYTNYEEDVLKLYLLKKKFIEEVTKIDGVSVNGVKAVPENTENSIEALAQYLASPHVISVSVKEVRSEVLLHSLEDKGIYVSAGSACSTHKRTPSATLVAIGLDKPLLESTVRFSLGIYNEEQDIDDAVKAMSEIIPMLKMYTRKR